jgi:hypothetical protein
MSQEYRAWKLSQFDKNGKLNKPQIEKLEIEKHFPEKTWDNRKKTGC